MARKSSPTARDRGPAPRVIAFLRAINVGGHIVKMAPLREQFEAMGFTGVETFIASGNVIFDAPREDSAATERRIELHLHRALGYEVATFLRSPAEVAAAAAHDAFPGSGAGDATYPVYIAFTRKPPTSDAERTLLGFRNDVDDFHVRGREIYWAARRGMGQSTFSGARLEKIIGMPATARNVTTVRKLAALTGTG
jgi:uncharacterized protein (DUF1697 family)